MKPAVSPVECGICNGKGPVFLFSARDLNFRTTDEEFSIFRCPACGVAQTIPRPAENTLARFYPPSYYPVGGYDQAYYRRKIQPAQKDKLAIVRRFRASGTLLDVGCGAGYFVREAAEGGFDAEGLELSPDAVEFGRKEFGVRILEGDLLHAQFADRSFDVVTLWHVLEHLFRPLDTLRKIRALLKPGGLLVIAVPNFDSIQARLFRQHWYHLEVPRHLYHFTPGSLRGLLTSEGFTVRAEIQRSREHDWAGILGSLVPLVPANGSLTGRIARLAAGRPLAKTAAAVESSFGRGGTFTLVSSTQD